MSDRRTGERALARVAAIALALPEAVRQDREAHADFRVRDKVFAYFLRNHHGDGIISVCCKTARDEHRDWVASDPVRYYLPAYIGARGWVGIRLDVSPVSWPQVADLINDSYRLTAPKRLVAMVREVDSDKASKGE